MAEPGARRRAFSYLRFSSPDQAKGDSFRRQMTSAVEYAAQHDLDLDDTLTFHDLGVSAFRGSNSETGQLAALLESIYVGLIPKNSVILVENLDRISRQSARKAIRVIETILESGVSVVTLTDRHEYTLKNLDDDPLSLLLAILTFIRANEESTLKSKRISAAWVAKRTNARSKPMTARCPGWIELMKDRQEFVLMPKQAETVRRIFKEALAGRGSLSISRRLNEDQVPVLTGGGKHAVMWYSSTVWKLLKNPATIGTLRPYRQEYVDGKISRIMLSPVLNYFPAVIPAADFEKLQLLRITDMDVTRQKQAVMPAYNIIGRLPQCSSCGSSMCLISKSRHGHYLVCRLAYSGRGCRHRSVRYREVERTIMDKLPTVLSAYSRSSSDDLTNRRIQLVQQLLQPIELDRGALNRGLRDLLKSIIVYPDEGVLLLNWRHGGESALYNAFLPAFKREKYAHTDKLPCI